MPNEIRFQKVKVPKFVISVSKIVAYAV